MTSQPLTPTPSESLPAAKKPGTLRVLARIWPYAKPMKWSLIWGAAAALGAGIVALTIPLVLEALVDGPLVSGDRRQIWWAAAAVLGLGVAEAALIAARRWFVLTPGTRIEASMRNSLYAKLQDLPVAFHDRWQSGQLLSRAVADLGLIRRWLSFGLVLFVVNLVTVAIGSVFLFRWHWLLGTVFLVTSLPLWAYGYVFEKQYSVIARQSQDQSGDLATTVEESVHGIRVLKAFGRGGHALRGFRAQAEQLRSTELKKARALANIWLWIILLPDLAFAFSLLAGLWLGSTGQITVGELFAFFATATVLRFPIESIGFLLAMTLDTRAAVDRFFEVMDTPNTITDPEHPVTIADPRGELVFEDVHFRYQDAAPGSRDLIDGARLTVRPGETMALVGVTGSGKTTLTALTTRLYDVTGGRVLLDGVDVRELTREELRRHIGMAFEEPTLFSSSVADNVLLGRNDLTPGTPEGDRVLREALEVAQADFVAKLPEGVDTQVGEEGLSLSGGQRQRLALARAVAADPRVLVMDDPLSALDVDTEARVEAGLRRALGNTTTLIVAHRPSTVMLADRVALMQDGRIVAVDTHQALLRDNEHYRYVIASLDAQVADEQRLADEAAPPPPAATDDTQEEQR